MVSLMQQKHFEFVIPKNVVSFPQALCLVQTAFVVFQTRSNNKAREMDMSQSITDVFPMLKDPVTRGEVCS